MLGRDCGRSGYCKMPVTYDSKNNSLGGELSKRHLVRPECMKEGVHGKPSPSSIHSLKWTITCTFEPLNQPSKDVAQSCCFILSYVLEP